MKTKALKKLTKRNWKEKIEYRYDVLQLKHHHNKQKLKRMSVLQKKQYKWNICRNFRLICLCNMNGLLLG
jgi:ribosomal protein S17E